jgi:hypothetical protein
MVEVSAKSAATWSKICATRTSDGEIAGVKVNGSPWPPFALDPPDQITECNDPGGTSESSAGIELSLGGPPSWRYIPISLIDGQNV